MFFKWALLNLYRNKRRSLTTAIALIFGFTGMLLLSGYIVAVERLIRTQMIYLNHSGHFSIYKKGAVENVYRNPDKYLLNLKEQEEISHILNSRKDDIENLVPLLSSYALLSSDDKNLPLFIQGYPKGFSGYITNHPELKKWLPTFQNKLASSDGVSLTPNLYLMLGKTFPLSEKTEVQILGKTIDGYVNGITDVLTGQHMTGFSFSEDISARMSLEKLQELLATEKVRNFAVFLKDFDKMNSFIDWLNKQLPAGKYEIFGFNSDEIGFYYTGTMSFLLSIGTFFYLLISMASILSIVNTLTMSINERTKEIGTLRSIGFTNQKVSNLFSIEILILTIICIFVSTFLYFVLSVIINKMKIPFEPAGSSGVIDFTLYISFSIAAIHGVALVIVTYITSYLSCKSKLKLNVADLLNEQGVFK